MKYILIKDFDAAEEYDDGKYLVKARLTPGDESPATFEPFTEHDIFKATKRAPEGADALILKDDWIYYSTKLRKELGYAFK